MAADGKSARGSRHGDAPTAYLLTAMTSDGKTSTQGRVPDKTNEITCFSALLAPFDLMGVVVTADTMRNLGNTLPFALELGGTPESTKTSSGASTGRTYSEPRQPRLYVRG
ncbi:hypothetical protein [Streptomyces sp. NPDC055709]